MFAAKTPAADTLEGAEVNYYPTTEHFGHFDGIDMVPENHDLFPAYSPWSKMDASKTKPGTILGRTCDAEQDDGSVWTVTRLGPFRTTGCYDWTQVGWDNAFDMEEKLKKYPDGVFVVEQFSGPVTEDGTRLSHPPIHIHHIHVGPKPGIRQRQDGVKCMLSDNYDDCYDPTRVLEHHGDYQCTEEEGGLDCLSETVPDGYGKLITYPLGIEGDMNDVRACGSPPLEYYYQLGVRWVPKVAADGTVSPLKPLNFYNFIGPGNMNFNDQLTYIMTYQSPTDRDTLFWYTGRMPHSGEMLRNKVHVHNKIFKEALVFAATPHELGLTKQNKLMPDKAYNTVDIKAAGFSDHDAVKKFLLRNLDESGKAYDSRVSTTKVSDFDYLTDDFHSRERPKAVCQVLQSLEEHDGYFYDRREPTCCAPWHIKKGDIFTVVGFNAKLDYKVGPHTDKIPKTSPAHVSLWMSWANEEDPPVSRFGIRGHNQEPSGGLLNPKFFPATQKIAYMLNGGVISNHQAVYHDKYIESTVIITVLRNPISSLLLLVGVVALSIYSCVRRCSGGKKAVTRKEFEMTGHATKTCPDPESLVRTVADAVTKSSEEEMVRAMKSN